MPNSLFAYIRRTGIRVQLVLAALSAVVFGLDLIPLELQRRIINDAVGQRAVTMLVWLALAYFVTVLLQGGIKLILYVYRGRVSEAANRRLRFDTFSAALRHPIRREGADREGVGVSIILSEVDPVGGFIGRAISDPVLHGGLLVGVFGYMVYLQPWMALVCLGLFGPQLVFVPLLQETINRRTASRIQVLRDLSVDIVNETVDQVSVREEDIYKSRVNEVYRLNMQIYRRKFSMNFAMNLLHHLGIVGVLFIGGWLVIRGRTELGTVVAFISGLTRINDPWNDLVTYFRDMTNARVKYQLIAGVLGEQSPQPVAKLSAAGE